MMTVGWLNGYRVKIHGKRDPNGNAMVTADLPGVRTLLGWVATDRNNPKVVYVRGNRARLWQTFTITGDDTRTPRDFVRDAITRSNGIPRRLWQ